MNSDTPNRADLAARELLRAADDSTWHAGSAEPWVADVLAALVCANATRVAVEIGCFEGYTTQRIADALAPLPWNTTLLLCEIDPNRAATVSKRLGIRRNVTLTVANSLDWIPTLPAESVDFVWLDGNHEKQHVMFELQALLTKMAPGGMICGHDVFGVCDLQQVFAMVAAQTGWRSMSLDLPRLGPAGGIGILQRPR